MAGHYLLLFDEGGEELTWEIEHPDYCHTRTIGEGDNSYDIYECPYEWEADAGRDPFEPWPTEPGRYRLEHWVTESRYPWVGSEYSTGVTVLERDEAYPRDT